MHLFYLYILSSNPSTASEGRYFPPHGTWGSEVPITGCHMVPQLLNFGGEMWIWKLLVQKLVLCHRAGGIILWTVVWKLWNNKYLKVISEDGRWNNDHPNKPYSTLLNFLDLSFGFLAFQVANRNSIGIIYYLHLQRHLGVRFFFL